mmetsp:Transcript_74464/g.241777  ORF Transcript_74464/g.241777 Transcript_74464/m.241777 type:complete len:241 (-) Transcript_74464:1001-1723(-)
MRRMEANILPAALETKPKDNLKTSASIVPRILEMLKFVFSVCKEFTVSCRISCSCEAACCIREASNVQESATSVNNSEAGTEEQRADSSKLHSATSMAASLRPGPNLASSSASSSSRSPASWAAESASTKLSLAPLKCCTVTLSCSASVMLAVAASSFSPRWACDATTSFAASGILFAAGAPLLSPPSNASAPPSAAPAPPGRPPVAGPREAGTLAPGAAAASEPFAGSPFCARSCRRLA